MNELHLPTIGGQNSVISLGSNADSGSLRYRAKLTQGGTNAPVEEVFENSIGAIVWSRDAVGSYLGTLSGAFAVSPLVYLTNGDRFGDITSVSGFKANDDALGIITTTEDNSNDDNWETFIDVILPPLDAEASFGNILGKLDSNQSAIWTKIVIRDGVTVTEVDGDKYRKTNNFNDSSKLINS